MSLEDLLRERIAADGPLTVADYMRLALYHPELGYYAAGPARTGWRGHFLTSPELDPAFGELWAAGIEQLHAACGRPAGLAVVEIGPGEAGFAEAVIEALPPDLRRATSYHLVERSPQMEARQRARLGDLPHVTWLGSLAELPPIAAGCVFANEVLDNQPVHLVENRAGEVVELYVGLEEDSLALTEGPPSPAAATALAASPLALPEGHRAEVSPAASALATSAAQVLKRGAVVFVDYGDEADRLVERPNGTLLCYGAGGADTELLVDPGHKDITAHANWSAVRHALERSGATVVGPLPQRAMLKRLGLDDLHDRLRREHHDAAGEGRGLEAVRLLSRRQALGALGDPGGLGGLGVLVGLVGITAPPFLAEE